MTISNNTIVNDDPGGAMLLNFTAVAPAFTDNSVYGLTEAQLSPKGPMDESGTVFLASRPSLDTSSLSFIMSSPPPSTPTPLPTVPVGSGADTLDLQVNEDAWNGDAQFTVAVDGQQIGGTLTALASHAAGATQDFLVMGNFGPGQHTATVTFLNDAYGGSPATDRNLYVAGASYDGVAASGSLALYSGGSQSLVVGSNPVGSVPATVPVGSGADTLDLQVNEDAWNGDAQFTVAVDGQQIGGTLTALASHAAGATQDFLVMGNFGPGQHTATVTFLNDAYGGSPATDRNLYVAGASYDGVAASGSLALYSDGSQSLVVGSNPVGSVPATVPVGSGADTLDLQVNEDAWNGDAQFTVAVDGQQIGGTLTALASHAAGATQDFLVMGNFGPGQHTATVTFLNDAYGGSPATDRNLYVAGASYDGPSVTEAR